MNEKVPVKYIFCINPGRSGSDYLAKLFRHVEGCIAFHEPEPIGHGKVMRRFADGDEWEMKKLAKRKAVHIQKQLDGGYKLYMESNHCFIKGFGWFMPEYLEGDIGIVILKRDPTMIANSLLRIGCTPLTEMGKNWILTPDVRKPLVKPPSLLFSPSVTYQLASGLMLGLRAVRYCFRKTLGVELDISSILKKYEYECLMWYVAETYARGDLFKKLFPNVKYYEADINSLNTLDSVQQMFRYFGCTNNASSMSIIGNPTNLKKEFS